MGSVLDYFPLRIICGKNYLEDRLLLWRGAGAMEFERQVLNEGYGIGGCMEVFL